jgi:hypothetical protein
MSKRYPAPEVSVSSGERGVIRQLVPLRATLEKFVRAQHERHGPMNEPTYSADVEVLWTLLLEAYTRGVGAVRTGLHQGEGIDHEMVDESVAFALERKDR